MRVLVALLIVFWAGYARANAGDACPVNTPTGQNFQEFSCKKLCGPIGNTNPITCGPIEVNVEDSSRIIFVATTGGCNFDDIAVGMLPTSTTTGYSTNIMGILDDDLTVGSVTGVSMVVWPLKTLPWLYVSAGNTTNCSTSTFEIWEVGFK